VTGASPICPIFVSGALRAIDMTRRTTTFYANQQVYPAPLCGRHELLQTPANRMRVHRPQRRLVQNQEALH
jgi:hypothetical protein